MERQLKEQEMGVLRFIYDYIKSNDCAPKQKEISKAFGITITAAYYRVHLLFDYGYLREDEPSQWGRNIALTEKGILACEGDK